MIRKPLVTVHTGIEAKLVYLLILGDWIVFSLLLAFLKILSSFL